MGKKIHRRKPKAKPKPQKRGSGAAILFFMGGAFTLFGIAEAINPIPFQTAGGLGRYGRQSVTTSYNASQSSGFGIFFALIGLALLYFGYYVVKNARKN